MKLLDIINEEMEIETPDIEKSIKNPSFIFEVNGNFNFKQLEMLLKNNEQGLALDNYELKINTKGLISDEDYENFVKEIEKLRFLGYLR